MNGIGECKIENWIDLEDNPSGGFVKGVGLEINWQDGPLGRGETRKEPNGAFVETIISAAIQRLKFFQESKFNCPENQDAIGSLTAALECLELRTKNRENAGIEGTHEV